MSGGLYAGIAPQVNFISLKISDDTGMAYESDAIAAMQWILDNKDRYNIRVVNLSINSTQESSYHSSPLDAAAVSSSQSERATNMTRHLSQMILSRPSRLMAERWMVLPNLRLLPQVQIS
jgi:hypothetical protein